MGARREASRPNPPLRDDAQVMFRINSVSWVRSQDTHRKALQGKPDGMGAASCHVPSGVTRSEAPGRRTARPSFASNRMGVVARISQDAPRDPAAAAAEPPDQGAHNEPRTPRQPPTPGPASGQHPAPSTQHPRSRQPPPFATSRPRSERVAHGHPTRPRCAVSSLLRHPDVMTSGTVQPGMAGADRGCAAIWQLRRTGTTTRPASGPAVPGRPPAGLGLVTPRRSAWRRAGSFPCSIGASMTVLKSRQGAM